MSAAPSPCSSFPNFLEYDGKYISFLNMSSRHKFAFGLIWNLRFFGEIAFSAPR
jgi:hypothetical protein